MRLIELSVGEDVTVQAHIDGQLYTTQSYLVKKKENEVILRLCDAAQFELYANKEAYFTLCYSADFGNNYVSPRVDFLYSQSMPMFVQTDGDVILENVRNRAHARFPYEYNLVLTKKMDEIHIKSIDISATGIGAMSPVQLFAGQQAYVDVYNPISKKSKVFRVKIASCTPKDKGQYFIGIKFEHKDQWILDFIDDLQERALQSCD